MKESFYKALYPLTGQMIGFDEVDVKLPFQNITCFVLRTKKPGRNITGRNQVGHRRGQYLRLCEPYPDPALIRS